MQDRLDQADASLGQTEARAEPAPSPDQPEFVRRLAGVMARLSEFQAGTNRRKVELIERVQVLKAALAGRSSASLDATTVPPRPSGQGFDDPGAFRDELTRWLDRARQVREQSADRAARLDAEIKGAGDDLTNLDRDLALSAIEAEDDVAFGLDDEGVAGRT